jgi:protein-L-isoaspartate(D-aspartate) O-methyltransferase
MSSATCICSMDHPPARAARAPTGVLPFAGSCRKTTPLTRAGTLAMTDFAAARRMMVDGQVRTSDVTDPRIIAAMLELPRERFVPESKAAFAYFDLDIAVTEPTAGQPARCLLKPMVLAKMVQAAAVSASDHVLDVGCATGYSSALLARLARSVVALEEDDALARLARENLKAVGADNVTVVTGPLTQGWQAAAPYDVILLNGATEIVPRGLAHQFKEGGRLIAVHGRAPTGQAMLYRRVAGDVSGWPIFDAAAPVLPGFAAPPAFVF